MSHYILLQLARTQGGRPRVDLDDPKRSGLLPHAHLRRGDQHIFLMTKTDILTGVGSGRIVELDPVVFNLANPIICLDGSGISFQPCLRSSAEISSQNCMSVRFTANSMPNGKAERANEKMAIDILFRDLSVWRQTIYSNPEGPTAPALLMPDPGTISQGAMTCLRDTLQEAADIALAKAMRINPNIERLFLAATPGAPRQDNIERKISLTLVFGLSNTRLMTSSFSDSRSIKQMAQQIFERGMGAASTDLLHLSPAWVCRDKIPEPGFSWQSALRVEGVRYPGGHRRAVLAQKWPGFYPVEP